MAWCPDCRTEYDPGYTNCSDCGAELVEQLPSRAAGGDPAFVYQAGSPAEADVVEATLESEGIPAYVSPSSVVLPEEGLVNDDSSDLDVLVPGDLAGAARGVLGESPISEEELAELAESQSDPRV